MTEPADENTQRIVVLNGPAGVGKTTVGRLLAATARNGVCIHGDDIKNFVVARDLASAPVGTGLTYIAGAALSNTYLAAGYELVVFEFIFTNTQQINRFLGGLDNDVPVHLLTLWAPLETVQRREASRSGREPLGERVTECWHELHTNLHELGCIIDATEPVSQVIAASQQKLLVSECILTPTLVR